MKIKLSAVIPTVQYGNIQPEFEIDTVEHDTTGDEAMALLETKIQELWDKYGEKPLVSKTATQPSVKRLKDFFGNEIDYDELNHVYSWKGDVYLSGSVYAKSKQKPFDAKAISLAIGKKFDVPAEDVAQMWALKSEASASFGTGLHKALELYGRYQSLAETLDKETHLHDHPVLKTAVQGFYEGRENEKAEYEVLVVDHEGKRAGTIDRLLITAPKTCRIQDFKTNVKEELEYWKDQLGFYEVILKANGWTVEGKDVFQWNGEWKEIKI